MSAKSSISCFASTTSASTSAVSTSKHTSHLKGRSYSKHFVKIPSILQSQLKVSKKQINCLKDVVNNQVLLKMSLQSRLSSAEDLFYTASFRQIANNMKSPSKLITYLLSRRTFRAPIKKRYTIVDKVLSLSLYCKSRKYYSLLAEIFLLPRANSIKELLRKIVVNPGINDVIFEKLKDVVDNLSSQNRLCSLIFKEMPLTPQINYDFVKDKLSGFVTIGGKTIANRVLVFMVKGLKSKYRQPVAYYLTNNLNKCDLKRIIRSVIEHTNSTGLKIICTVCIPTSVNVGAITDLVNETKESIITEKSKWKNDFFKIQNHNIIPLYDVRHLLKELRNNLLTRDLKYIDFDDDNKENIMKWEYIQMVYNIDKNREGYRYLSKLTEEHINPDKIKRNNVQTAVQVFSHRVAALTNLLTANVGGFLPPLSRPPILPDECRQLVPITKLFDNLLDSLNGNTVHLPDGKKYQGCLKKSSPHHQLWDKALITLKSIKFIEKRKFGDKITATEECVSAVELFIKTIEGMQVIWTLLYKKYLVKHLLTRNFSLDPIEKFFMDIKSFAGVKCPPNFVSFDRIFKSILLNKYNRLPDHIYYYEKEYQNLWLFTLKFMIFHKRELVNLNTGININQIICGKDNLNDFNKSDFNTSDSVQKTYLCYWVFSKCYNAIIMSCKICQKSLICENSSKNTYIRAKEYNGYKRWVSSPSANFEICFNDLHDFINSLLNNHVPIHELKNNIMITYDDEHIGYPFECNIHREKLIKYFKDVTINITIYTWCRSVNRILSGRVTYNGDDEVKVAAQLYYQKHWKK